MIRLLLKSQFTEPEVRVTVQKRGVNASIGFERIWPADYARGVELFSVEDIPLEQIQALGRVLAGLK